MTIRFVLYTREGCHLCEAMESELSELEKEMNFEIKKSFIDEDQILVDRYGDVIPLLMLEDQIVCKTFLDVDRVREVLQEYQ